MAEFQRRDGENTGPQLCALGGGRVLYSVQCAAMYWGIRTDQRAPCALSRGEYHRGSPLSMNCDAFDLQLSEDLSKLYLSPGTIDFHYGYHSMGCE